MDSDEDYKEVPISNETEEDGTPFSGYQVQSELQPLPDQLPKREQQ